MDKPDKRDFGYKGNNEDWSRSNKDDYFLACMTYRRLLGISESEGNMLLEKKILNQRKSAIMKKPDKKDFGWEGCSTFDGQPAGWTMEGGEEAYVEACKRYEDVSNRIVKRKRSYTFTIEEYTDGCRAMIRHNDGFTALELIGICSMISREVVDQQEGRIRPDIIKRNYIEHEEAK